MHFAFFTFMISDYVTVMLSRPYRRCGPPPMTTRRDYPIGNSVGERGLTARPARGRTVQYNVCHINNGDQIGRAVAETRNFETYTEPTRLMGTHEETSASSSDIPGKSHH